MTNIHALNLVKYTKICNVRICSTATDNTVQVFLIINRIIFLTVVVSEYSTQKVLQNNIVIFTYLDCALILRNFSRAQFSK